MSLAINEAWKYQILTYPNPAVGCVILDRNGRLLSVAAHKKAGYAHAELSAIILALQAHYKDVFSKILKEFFALYPMYFADLGADISYKNSQNIAELLFSKPNIIYELILKFASECFLQASAYVTLEPCSHSGKTPSCANLLARLKFKEVIISCRDNSDIARGGCEILKSSGVSVTTGVCESEGARLIKPFLSWQSGKGFGFFKIAMSKNGVISGGTISNKLSRTHMHALRDKIDLLVIGGNTVRIDRPTLDSRLVNGANPDVLIYSKNRDFDRDIELFKVKDRSVKICDNLEDTYGKLVMYEGGNGLFELAISGRVPNLHWFLIYQSSEFKKAGNIISNVKLKPLYTGNFGDDSYGWYGIDV